MPIAAATRGQRTIRLTEDARLGSRRVDYDAGVIRGVKILGTESQNGIDDDDQVERRVYSPQALKGAVRLYEGAKVNVNHPGEPSDRRDSEDGFGILRSVHTRADGLYGDLHFLKSHPMAARVCEAAERMPQMYGLSHNADARGSRKGDAWVVEEIVKVRSVDLVRDPATTKGLFEGRDMADEWDDDKKDKTALMDDDDLDLDTPDLDADPDMDGDVDTDPTLDTDMDAGTGGWRQSLADMISAIVLDDTLDQAEIKAKVTHALAILEKGQEEAAPAPSFDTATEAEDEDDDEEKKPTEESCDEDEDKKMKESVVALARKHPGVMRLVEQLDNYKVRDKLARKRKAANKLMESAKLPKEARTKVFLEQLMRAADAREMKALVEDRKAMVARPRSHGRNNGAPSVSNPKETAARIRNGQE